MPKRSKLVAADPTKTVLEPEEAERVEAAAKNLCDRLLVRICRQAGCRISEVLSLEVKDVDFRGGGLVIQHLKERVSLKCPECGHRLARDSKFCTGCGQAVGAPQSLVQEQHSRRFVPVDKITLDLLKEYIRSGRPSEHQSKGPIFRISYRRAYQIVVDLAAAAGLPNIVLGSGKVHHISPHRLRDAHATNWSRKDPSMESMRHLQEQLGHKEISTSMKYVKLTVEGQRAFYDKIHDEESGGDAA